MHNLEITRSFKIKATFTAEEWRLFTESMDCEYVTRILNEQLVLSCGTHSDRNETEREMEGIMSQFSHFGASEAEPREHLTHVLDYIYGPN